MLALLDFARAVHDGLSKPGQRELPSIYLYDEIGTALFEAITFLPEYGLTRADERLLRRHAPAILEHLPPPVVVAELGSGSGRKTRWLLGTDLEKPVAEMLLAYDDPTGVTAAFNLNLLARINRELGGDFALRHFVHEAKYDKRERRIEMHLRSLRKQSVTIREAGFTCTLEKGETIWTEACHKYRVEEIPGMGARTGFVCEGQWVDGEWPFAENLWIAAAPSPGARPAGPSRARGRARPRSTRAPACALPGGGGPPRGRCPPPPPRGRGAGPPRGGGAPPARGRPPRRSCCLTSRSARWT